MLKTFTPLLIASFCILSACTAVPVGQETQSSSSSSEEAMQSSSASPVTVSSGAKSSALSACSWEDCKPAMGMPNWQCADGTMGGPNCERNQQGQCGWVIHQCSSSSSSVTADDCLCPNDLAWDETTQTCIAKGQSMCPQYMKPGGFCGCDGKTYANSCYAAQAGVKQGEDCGSLNTD